MWTKPLRANSQSSYKLQWQQTTFQTTVQTLIDFFPTNGVYPTTQNTWITAKQYLGNHFGTIRYILPLANVKMWFPNWLMVLSEGVRGAYGAVQCIKAMYFHHFECARVRIYGFCIHIFLGRSLFPEVCRCTHDAAKDLVALLSIPVHWCDGEIIEQRRSGVFPCCCNCSAAATAGLGCCHVTVICPICDSLGESGAGFCCGCRCQTFVWECLCLCDTVKQNTQNKPTHSWTIIHVNKEHKAYYFLGFIFSD